MDTTTTVTRGQRTDPHPVYVLPYLQGMAEAQRQLSSRLGECFIVEDNTTAANGYFVKNNSIQTPGFVRSNIDSELPTYSNSKDSESYVHAGMSMTKNDLNGKSKDLVDLAKSVVEDLNKESDMVNMAKDIIIEMDSVPTVPSMKY